MQTVHVDLGSRGYDIQIADGLLNRVGSLLADLCPGRRTVIITNTTVAPLYLDAVTASLHAQGFTTSEIVLPDGEQYKTLEQMHAVYDRLAEFGLDRSCALIALGGGVVGDMTGFAAATFLRGVPFVQVPTTLLAQVDSSVGGKTGVNLMSGKNLVGAFYQPSVVIVDPQVLSTLPDRELRAGLAEVIKYGIIRDADFFALLERSLHSVLLLDTETLAGVLRTCCRIKADITARDETETGIRAILNFGHTIGHAIETLSDYTEYLHGEAVAIGMLAAAKLSCSLGMCGSDQVGRIGEIIRRAGLPDALPDFSADAYVQAVLKDKKRSADRVNFVLMRNIGRVCLQPIEPDCVRDFLIRELR